MHDSAGEAEALLAQQSFDLVLTDERLSGASGVDLFDWARDQGQQQPFVLLSGAPESFPRPSSWSAAWRASWPSSSAASSWRRP